MEATKQISLSENLNIFLPVAHILHLPISACLKTVMCRSEYPRSEVSTLVIICVKFTLSACICE
jgi:hypothetical protein